MAALPPALNRQAIVRLLPSGWISPLFKVMAPPGVQAIASDTEGRVLASVGLEQRLVVLRFSPPGNLDAGFGEGGSSTLAIPSAVGRMEGTQGTVLSVDGRGRVLVARLKTSRTSFRRGTGFIVARLLPDGRPDPSFGTDGLLTAPLAHSTPYRLNALLVDPASGAVTLLATAFLPVSHGAARRKSVQLTRIRPDGTLDSRFGDGGTLRIGLGGRLGMPAVDMAADSHGRSVVAGADPHRAGFVRLLPDGSIPPSAIAEPRSSVWAQASIHSWRDRHG